MIQSDEDKRLVQQYRQTNIALRKQLNNLNNEIDRMLIKRAHKIGLQKLPNVSKKITDPTIMQHEIQNLKKRLQQLQRDLEIQKSRTSINYYIKIKQLQTEVQERDSQMDQCRRNIKLYERKDKIFNVQAAKSANNKIDLRIAKLQQQIGRCHKLEKDLIKQINLQEVSGQKSNGYLQQLTQKHNEAASSQKEKLLSLAPTIEQKKKSDEIGQQEWKQLKKEFLIFKQTKQNEEYALNQQNERLRGEVKEWEKKVKEKRKRIESITQLAQRNKGRQSRIYNTINDQNQSREYRYRDKNNSVQYNKKQ